MTDFPRGWLLTGGPAGAGTAASITVPSIAGVVHVLDSITATLLSFAAAAGGSFSSITVGGIQVMNLAFGGGAFGTDVGTLSGMDVATAPGAALIVAFNQVTITNYVQLLVIQGHDI